jgi:hypothetical protein
VEVVVLLGDGRPALPPPRRVDLLQPLGQAGARVLGELLQRRQPAIPALGSNNPTNSSKIPNVIR